MSADGISLLSFLDTPLLVGDPEGRVVYLNPAFSRAFQLDADQCRGEPLGELFAGGGREAILQAVARVCAEGRSVRFRLREGDAGYVALASPIEADTDRVGVIILLTDESASELRLLACDREIREPIEEIQSCFEELIEEIGGQRNDRFRSVVERGLSAVERARKWSSGLHDLLSGGETASAAVKPGARLDPVQVLREVAARIRPECDQAGVRLEVLTPARLPEVAGDGAVLEAALVGLVRQRLAALPTGAYLTLAGRVMGESAHAAMLISVIDPLEAPAGEAAKAPDSASRAGLAQFGARTHCIADAAGHVTAIAFDLDAS